MSATGSVNSRLDGLLEIHLYEVELRIDDSSSQGQHEPVRGPAAVSLELLRAVQSQPGKYGEMLTAAVFHSEAVRSAFGKARAAIEARGGHLRISLVIDPSAPQLHALAWELLRDPLTGGLIATNEATPFSRFLFGRDWTSLPVLHKSELKALVVVPNHSNPEEWGLTAVDARAEIERARDALEGIRVTVLEGAATLDALVESIGQGFDIVYLVCHGALCSPDTFTTADDFESGYGEGAGVSRERGIKVPVLYLELDETHEVDAVGGGRLARRLGDLRRRPLPRLMVLVSCESAGVEGDWTGQSAQASLAPRLARAGVPALIAMQGKISVPTVARFIKPFFSQLVEHGRIDQAMTTARGRVRDMPDCWMPALFLRLKDGRLWYEPGFTPGAKVGFVSIAAEIAAGKFTPILGWGLADRVYGSKAELSRRLAEEKGVPLEGDSRTALALVSQYLQLTARSDTSALNDLKERMRMEILERFKDRFSEDLSGAPLSKVLNAAGKIRRGEESDPYRIVASLPATVFINANPDGLLTEALKAAGKTPMIRTPYWRFSSVPAEAERLNPTELNPLVLHVFGSFANPESLVLGEDDYLDFLMGVAQNQALISNVVKDALTNRALMFLGFQMTDWTFRVLFRIVMKLLAGAQDRQRRRPNVAVQVEPDGSLFSGVEEAKHYLQKFYGPFNIEPFWGTSEDFLTELRPALRSLLARREAEEDAY
jgi:hypothetical protein